MVRLWYRRERRTNQLLIKREEAGILAYESRNLVPEFLACKIDIRLVQDMAYTDYVEVGVDASSHSPQHNQYKKKRDRREREAPLHILLIGMFTASF